MHLLSSLLETIIMLPLIFGSGQAATTTTEAIAPTPTVVVTATATPMATEDPATVDAEAARRKTPTPTPPPAAPPLRRLALRLKDFRSAPVQWVAGSENTYTQNGYTCVERYFYGPEVPERDDRNHVWSHVCRFDTLALAIETFAGWSDWSAERGFSIQRPYSPVWPVDEASAGRDTATQTLTESWYSYRKGNIIISVYYYAIDMNWLELQRCEAVTIARFTNSDAAGDCRLQ